MRSFAAISTISTLAFSVFTTALPAQHGINLVCGLPVWATINAYLALCGFQHMGVKIYY
jgi:hypothetical protein